MSQCWRPCRLSRIEVQGPQGNVQEGQRLMIIEPARYNKIGGLLIEVGSTGSWGYVCYQDEVRMVTVTMAAVHMGKREMGM